MSLVPRSEFVGLDGCAYLYTGAEGPLQRICRAAMGRYADRRPIP